MDDEHVNLWIHHGGKWDCPKKKKQYLGGEVKKMENVDIDYLSKFELDGYAQDLGYTNGVDMWFRRFSEMCGPVSLQEIGCDKDVQDMLVCKIMDPHIDVYFVSKNSKKGNFSKSPPKPNSKNSAQTSLPNQTVEATHCQLPTQTSEEAHTTLPTQSPPIYHTPPITRSEDPTDPSLTILGIQFGEESEPDEDYQCSTPVSDSSSIYQSDSNLSETTWLYEDLQGSEEELFHEAIDDLEEDLAEKAEKAEEANEGRLVEHTVVNEEDLGEFNEIPAYSEDLHSLRGSSDDEAGHGQFTYGTTSKVSDLRKGMKFSSHHEFRKALKDWAIKAGFDFTYQKNTRANISVVCKNKETCSFRVHGSQLRDAPYFEIKTFRPKHDCPFTNRNCLISSTYLSEKYLDELRDNPDWDVNAMQKTIQRQLRAEVSLAMCYRARVKAKAKITGDIKEQYRRLRDYAETVIKFNPGSVVKIKTELREVEEEVGGGEEGVHRVPRELPMLQYMYMRFTAQKQGYFSGIRPLICLDGCHLKTSMGGQLLCAVARDGNENMFPIAIAYVDSEDKASWTWFLEVMFEDFGRPEETDWVFMSDKQKVLFYLKSGSYVC
ncbi:unnamed protein product [Cuscuta epithymum]|uniref:Transposase MuDR plant domain-containing protein n=1 Tax=Cuscuta epithymum TaxID=186058 RepID=A0AAV0CD47_9ASTE|nr:unnamed protein product [Cuscuta epithymum]